MSWRGPHSKMAMDIRRTLTCAPVPTLFGSLQLLYLREKAREFIANNGVRVLCDMLTLAHLHVQRAETPLQVRVLRTLLSARYRAPSAHRAFSHACECRR